MCRYTVFILFSDCKLYITVKYLNLRVVESLFSNPDGYRLYFHKNVQIRDQQEFAEVTKALFTIKTMNRSYFFI